jgi:uncharacterized protein GlcG (DUF336 family)
MAQVHSTIWFEDECGLCTLAHHDKQCCDTDWKSLGNRRGRLTMVGHTKPGVFALGRPIQARPILARPILARPIFRALATAAGVLLVFIDGAAAGPVEDLPGYWTGLGSITMSSGNTEQLKCVVTYKVNGASLKQNMRCASAAYTINGIADLDVRGDKVTGKWEEQTYAATGEVTGRVVDGGFTLIIKGVSFTAGMTVSGTNCKQQIAITPTGLEVAKIAIGLGKC